LASITSSPANGSGGRLDGVLSVGGRQWSASDARDRGCTVDVIVLGLETVVEGFLAALEQLR
jgi:hypothetical protein